MVSDADPTHAFISQFRLEGADGPLAGLTLAVKDLFDIAGHKTGFGSPTWLETHGVAATNAPPVAALLAAGATIVGKAHMSELAYSLDGSNAHYGAPVNAAAPGRNTGGSSSGSAAAVAGGQADIGLGSDTGGSIRIPASYCGLYGLRPTWGRISLQHACPLAPSFDTVGWLARDAALLQRVGQVLLPPASKQPGQLKRWLVGKDAFALAELETSKAIYDALSQQFDAVQAALGGAPTEVDIAGAALEAEGLGQLQQWADVFRLCQGFEIWQALGPWVTEAKPNLGPGVSDRFKMASGISREEAEAAGVKRQRLKQHLLDLLGSDGLLAVPSAPGPAFQNEMQLDPAAFQQLRMASLSLTCIAGLGGLPQVSIPIAKVDGAPVGLSFIGPPGSDEELLAAAARLAGALQQS